MRWDAQTGLGPHNPNLLLILPPRPDRYLSTSMQQTFQWGCGNYSGFGDGGAYDGDGVGDNEPAEFTHPCTKAPPAPPHLHLPRDLPPL